MEYMSLFPRQPVSLIMAGLFLAGLLHSGHAAQAADVTQIRTKPMGHRTEIILDLAGQPADLSVDPTDPKLVTVQFSGKLAASLKDPSRGFPGHVNLKSLYMESRNGKVQVFIKRQGESNVNVYPLQRPDRLVINVEETYEYHASAKVAPGVIHQHIYRMTSRGPLSINVLDIDPKNPEINIEPVLASNTLHGTARVSQMVDRYDAVAGINGAFFKPDSGTKLGTVILNRELIAGPIFNRVSLGMTDDGAFKMARISLRGQISDNTGKSLPIHNVNQPRVIKGQYILYSSRWGRTAPPAPNNGIAIQIDGNSTITRVDTKALPIPRDGYVLTGPDNGLAGHFTPGTSVGLSVYTTPDWSGVTHALGGGPYLVKEGQPYVDIAQESFRKGSFTKPAPRTAVGYTRDNHLLMVTVDGRQNASTGVTLWEMAAIMKELGAINAMNFDGGSSTQMVVRGKVVNSPTVAGGARVSSSLIVRHTPDNQPPEVIGARSDDESSTIKF